MQLDDIEHLERTVLSLVVQALHDYWTSAVTIFREETDQAQDIAEDITREAIASMGVSGTQDRLYGKVDVKKAIYAFLPEPTPVALMLDAKAEKHNGDSTATIQMSQTSMQVRLRRRKQDVDEPGKLETAIHRGDRAYQVVTVIAKFVYEEQNGCRELLRIIVACIPSGALQERYNPTAGDTIWRAGRDAPSLSEDFRVRLSYYDRHKKADWRVQIITEHEAKP